MVVSIELSAGRPFHLGQSTFYGMCTLHKVATLPLLKFRKLLPQHTSFSGNTLCLEICSVHEYLGKTCCLGECTEGTLEVSSTFA